MSNSKLTLVLCSIGFFALGAIIAIGAEHLIIKPSDPRDSMQTIKAFQDWRLTCAARTEKKGGCVVQSAVFDRATGTPLIQLTVGKNGQADTLAIVAPLGVLVPPGLRISMGSGPQRPIAFKTCIQAGCIATLPLDSGLTDAMSTNTDGQIILVNGVGKAVGMKYSLKGFKDALDARAVDTEARKEY